MKAKDKLNNIDRLWKNTQAKIITIKENIAITDETDKLETINFLIILLDMCDLFLERRKIKTNLKALKYSTEDISRFIEWYYQDDIKERYHTLINNLAHLEKLYELFLSEEALKK